MKEIVGIIAVALTFIGYASYFRDIFKGKTKPHLFSWFIWTLVTGIICALQIKGGAGAGAWVTIALTIILFSIFVLSFKYGSKDIRKIDIVFLVLALLALPLWFIAKQPALSSILLSVIDMLGFLPTVRKSWHDPYSETLSLYTITTLRHGLSLLALAQYNVLTVLFPASWVIANAAFSVILIVRRKKLSHGNN